MRPALGDHLGAGVIGSYLGERGYKRLMSPEAVAAASVFAAAAPRLGQVLQTCLGGRELNEKVFGRDVTVAAGLDASTVVPFLRDGPFQPA